MQRMSLCFTDQGHPKDVPINETSAGCDSTEERDSALLRMFI